ncbi:MAG: transcriptional repressor, BirA-like [Actinomycetia bacterium]|nr:transcriptional repressor, BirA-like [Actinomycetes bacterium]
MSAPVRWDDVTESTNATALVLAAEGAPSWTLVAAAHQTAGRGRHGRVWRDRPGSALLCSLVLRPDWPPDRVGLVSLAVGAAMAEAISEIAGVEIRCKWPNDLMADDAKIGGILGEAQVSAEAIAHVVVGIGVNVDMPEGVPGAGAIGDVDVETLLANFLRRCSSMLGASADEILPRWRAVSLTLGRRVEATTVDGDVARGVAVDIDDTGALLIDTDVGPARVAFGEVEHLDVATG